MAQGVKVLAQGPDFRRTFMNVQPPASSAWEAERRSHKLESYACSISRLCTQGRDPTAMYTMESERRHLIATSGLHMSANTLPCTLHTCNIYKHVHVTHTI